MSTESERRQNYHEMRLLVETARILTPQFDASIVYLTGAQLELLRNVAQYLDRQDSFVSEYHPDFYLTPTDAEWNTLQAIVDDLKEELMGNANTIWGFYEQWFEWLGETKSGDGQFIVQTAVVPTGYVYRLEHVAVMNRTRAATWAQFAVVSSGCYNWLMTEAAIALGKVYVWHGLMTLAEGDRVYMLMAGNLDGDIIDAGVLGYKVKLPT